MKKLPLIILILLVGWAGYWGYQRLFPSDQTVIRNLLKRAAELAAINPNEGALQKIAAVRSLTTLCTEDVELALQAQGLPNHDIHGRDQLGEALAAVRASVHSLSLDISDIGIAVDKEQGRATAQFIARVRIDGRADEIVQEFKLGLRREEGGWKIHQVEPLASLTL